MEFPIFDELQDPPCCVESFDSYLDQVINYSKPSYINVNKYNLREVRLLISAIKKKYNSDQKKIGAPYPLYLVGNIIKSENFDWKYFVTEEKKLPKYFNRKIYLKNSNQIKEMLKFQVYQAGLSEQNPADYEKKMIQFSRLNQKFKKERIKNLKLNKILSSHRRDEQYGKEQRN